MSIVDLVDIRWAAYQAVGRYRGLPRNSWNKDSNHQYLDHLMGFKDWSEAHLAQERNPALNRFYQALAGPHGYAIYKALVINNE